MYTKLHHYYGYLKFWFTLNFAILGTVSILTMCWFMYQTQVNKKVFVVNLPKMMLDKDFYAKSLTEFVDVKLEKGECKAVPQWTDDTAFFPQTVVASK